MPRRRFCKSKSWTLLQKKNALQNSSPTSRTRIITPPLSLCLWNLSTWTRSFLLAFYNIFLKVFSLWSPSMMLNATNTRNRSPFTPTQWQELEHHALIYKYMVSGVPIPPELIYSVKRSLESSLASRLFPHQSRKLYIIYLLFSFYCCVY